MAKKVAPKAEPSLEGLTPRDWLAAQAMSGICASRSQHPVGSLGDTAQETAAVAYILADQMLEMRRFDSAKLKGWLMARRVSQTPMVPITPIGGNGE